MGGLTYAHLTLRAAEAPTYRVDGRLGSISVEAEPQDGAPSGGPTRYVRRSMATTRWHDLVDRARPA